MRLAAAVYLWICFKKGQWIPLVLRTEALPMPILREGVGEGRPGALHVHHVDLTREAIKGRSREPFGMAVLVGAVPV